jgi:hypothetical protein
LLKCTGNQSAPHLCVAATGQRGTPTVHFWAHNNVICCLVE